MSPLIALEANQNRFCSDGGSSSTIPADMHGSATLEAVGTPFDCERQLVVVRTLSGGELTVNGEGIRVRSTFWLASRAKWYIQHGCLGHLAYMVDT